MKIIKQKKGCPWCGSTKTELCVTAVAWLECANCGAQNGQQVEPSTCEFWAYTNGPYPERVINELTEFWDNRYDC